jgi:hypothetical protein
MQVKAVASRSGSGDGSSPGEQPIREGAAREASPPADGYSPDEHRPLAAYAALSGVFQAGFLSFCLSQGRREESLPTRIPAKDILLLAVATQKVSRQLAKDKVTSFLRAPFVRYEGSAGPSEVSEAPRGRGLRYALGELLTCPFCLSQWVSVGMVWGYVRRPNATRSVATVFAITSAADLLQLLYAEAQERT